MTRFIPYIANASLYLDTEPPLETKKFYILQKNNQEANSIKIVSPAEQAVERARSTLKKTKQPQGAAKKSQPKKRSGSSENKLLHKKYKGK